MKKVMFIINPQAGIGRGKRCSGKIIEWLAKNKKRLGIKPDIFFSKKTGKKNATKLAKRAIRENYSLIVAVGGDGTAQEVANGVVSSNLPVAFVPAGSGNDFTKALGIPKNIEEALVVAFSGKVKPVDVGVVNGRVFVNVFGVGFDAKITQYAEKLKRKWSRFPNTLLYLTSLLRELFLKLEYQHVEVMFSEQKNFFRPIIRPLIGRVTLVAVANGPCCGGVFKIAPQADLADGLLDICWIEKTGRDRIFRFIPKGIAGTHLSLPEVKKAPDGKLPRASSLVISSLDHKTLPYQMDGEIASASGALPEAKEYQISVLPKSFHVIVP